MTTSGTTIGHARDGAPAAGARRVLLVMRHAKSDWDAGVEGDHARPLNRRGRRDAPRMARALDEVGLRPQWVLLSDARRTTETLERMRAAWDEADARDDEDRRVDARADHDLYLASAGELADAVAAAPEGVDRLMVLAHNPGCEGLVAWLAGEQLPMTTANVVALSPPPGTTWSQAVEHPGAWRVERVLRPKEL